LGTPVFFTLVTVKGRPFLLDPGVPELVVEAIDWNAVPRGTCVICYCVMPDHVHVIACNTRKGEDIRDFAAGTKKRCWFLFRDMGLEPPFWQRSYWDEHARACDCLADQVAYVLDNPVKAGLCRRAEDWPYSEHRGFYLPDDERHRRERGPGDRTAVSWGVRCANVPPLHERRGGRTGSRRPDDKTAQARTSRLSMNGITCNAEV